MNRLIKSTALVISVLIVSLVAFGCASPGTSHEGSEVKKATVFQPPS